MVSIYSVGVLTGKDHIREQQIWGYSLILIGTLMYNDVFPFLKLNEKWQ